MCPLCYLNRKQILGSLKQVIKAQQDQTQLAILLPHPHALNKWLEQQGARETKTQIDFTARVTSARVRGGYFDSGPGVKREDMLVDCMTPDSLSRHILRSMSAHSSLGQSIEQNK